MSTGCGTPQRRRGAPRARQDPPVSTTAPRIVIADDSPGMRLLLRATLERSGEFAVVGEASDGTSAITLTQDLRPDLLVLDLSMPGVDGFAVLSELRHRTPEVLVVIHSGLDRELTGLGPEDGVAAYLSKDLPAEELVARLRSVLRSPVQLPVPRASAQPVTVDLLVRLRTAMDVQQELLATDLDRGQVLELIASRVCALVDGDGASVVVAEERALVHRGACGTLARYEGTQSGPGRAAVQLALETGQAALIRAPDGAALSPERTASALAVPLPTSDAGTAVVLVISSRSDAFAAHDQHLLGLLAPLAAARLDLDASSAAQRASERLYRTAVDGAPIGMALVSLAGRFLDVNGALCSIVGYSREELLQRTFAEITFEPDLAADLAQAQALAAGAVPSYSMEKRYIRADGSLVWIRLHGSLVRSDDGAPLHFIAQIEDIGEAKAQQAALERLTLSDPLTGLANRSCVMDRLRSAITRQARHGGTLAVLLIDLDHFKVVNDSLGHQAGDALLCLVGERLTWIARASDTVGRLGGDEFLVLLEATGSGQYAMDAAQRIVSAITQPIALAGHGDVRVGASVGVAVLDGGGGTAEDLYRQADLALYAAKGRGRGRVGVYDTALDTSVRLRHETENALRAALATGGVIAHYQPIVDLDTGHVVAVEALARLRDSLVGAEQFIAVAEDTGLVAQVDAAVLTEVRKAFGTSDPALRCVRDVHVNVSAHSLASPAWRQVAAGLANNAVPVALEVTEQVLLHPHSSATAELERLVSTGVRIGLDDFGTGFSSLSSLHERPLSFIKLDRSFTASLPDNEGARSVVAGVLTMTRRLGLTVVAEGVETQEQLDVVRELGCDRAQGFLLGRPVPLSQLPELLGDQAPPDALR